MVQSGQFQVFLVLFIEGNEQIGDGRIRLFPYRAQIGSQTIENLFDTYADVVGLEREDLYEDILPTAPQFSQAFDLNRLIHLTTSDFSY